MRPKSLLLVVIALGCGLVAAFAAFQVVGSQQGGPPPVETVKVLVAMVDVDIDDQLDSTNVELEEWPADRVPEGAMMELDQLEGKYAKHRLYQGEIIVADKVIDSQDRSSKAMDIPKGYRVTTVRVEIETSHHGLMNPGDRVDILVFLKQSRDVPVTGIRSVLRDVRIFAVNAETERAYDKEGNTMTAKTVSFLVTPEQAAKVQLASKLGNLQLALRNPGEENTEDEQDTNVSLESILNGESEIADDDENNKLATMEPTNSEMTPAVQPPKAEYVLEIVYPDGAERYEWMDKAKLPQLATDNPEYPVSGADPASDPQNPSSSSPDSNGDRELPDFDDGDGIRGGQGSDDSDDSLDDPLAGDSF